VLDGRLDVGLNAFLGRLGDVRRVVEFVVSLRRAGGPAEVVDRNCVVAPLGKA
jgi:hypothetical protein